MRVRKLFFILFLLFGLPTSFVSADGLDSIGTTSISYISRAYAMQYYPSPDGSYLGAYIAPYGTETFRRINTYVAYDIATTTLQVRANLYFLDDGYNDDTPVLIDYSDWVTVTADGSMPRSLVESDLYTFDFGHDVSLSGGLYLLTFTEKNDITSTDLSIGFVNESNYGVAEIDDRFVGNADWYTVPGTAPRDIGAYKGNYATGSTFAIYTDNLVGSSTSYIAINDVYAWETDGATTTYTALDCSHASGLTTYYDFCYDSATTTEFVSAGGNYVVPDGDYKITYTLLDNDSLPIKMTYNILYEQNSTFYYIVNLDDITPYGDTYEFGIRICVEPEFYFDDGDTACSQVNYIMCTTDDDCVDSVIRWSENDGIQITGNETSDAGALAWLGQILDSGPGSYFLNFATTTLSNTFPFSIPYTIYDMYNIYESSFSTTTYVSSTTAGFYIGLDMSEFGLPTTTAGIPLSAMAQYAKTDISPELFDTIDTFLWSFFWFFVVFRIVTGGWHSATELASTQSKADVIRDRNRRSFVETRSYTRNRLTGKISSTDSTTRRRTYI